MFYNESENFQPAAERVDVSARLLEHARQALDLALQAVRALDIPHLEFVADSDEIIH